MANPGKSAAEKASERAAREILDGALFMVLKFVIVLISRRRQSRCKVQNFYCNSRGSICRRAAALRSRT